MTSPLVRCSTCKRHIYATDASCPFCVRQTNATPAILAAAISAGMGMAGCAGEPPPQTPPPRPIEIVQPDPIAPPPKEIATDPQNTQPTDPIRVAPAYGGPPAREPVVPPAAAYGAPPPMVPSPPPPKP